MRLSNRVTGLTESQTLAMAKKSRELQAKGLDVISLSIGEPDFDTPDFIKDAAKKAIDENYTRYTPVAGYPELRKAIALKLKRDNGLDYTADNIVVSTGAKQSLANAILSIIDEGDEVIVPTPYWVSYSDQIKLAGGKISFLRTTVERDFKFTAKELEEKITPKTRLLIFSTPCNPTGTVYTKEELKAIAEVIARHKDIYIISDEIYEHINFIGSHESIAQFPEVKDQVITVNGVSKGFAMTGWRIGYVAASLPLAQACEKIQGQFTSGTCSIAQRASIAAVEADPIVTQEMCKAFLRRRDLMVKLLKEVPGFKCNVPQGAFYVFPDVTYYFGKKYQNEVINNSQDLAMYLLNKALVAVVSGEAFGDNDYIRLSYATSDDKLIESVRRIKAALAELV
jgi:aspartate aminotransferase